VIRVRNALFRPSESIIAAGEDVRPTDSAVLDMFKYEGDMTQAVNRGRFPTTFYSKFNEMPSPAATSLLGSDFISLWGQFHAAVTCIKHSPQTNFWRNLP
jgi:hypothetical protein